ncbi:MAG: outer membrane beta-barrel protein [Candidatus Longimicrobiales bacterium M2_2A_002]
MSLNTRAFFGATAVAALLVAGPAAAQDSPFSLEARSGVTFPTGDLSDAGFESGVIFGVDLFFAVDRALSLYAGWGQHGFSDDVSVSGPRVGAKVLFHTPGLATPWIRAGATFNELDGDLGVSSDRETGLEAGAGIDYELSDRVSVTPAARYHTFSPEGVTVSYLTLDLGLHLHF